jgi:CubicO group peptidase (beta-lactamase class C family)
MVKTIEQRIDRVIQNLLPQTAFEGNFGSPKSLAERLTQCHTPGASIAVINNFEIEWARGFGICETETANEVKPTTLFQAGSISKPIFALAVMRLVQEGQLDLDEDVNAYLTEQCAAWCALDF